METGNPMYRIILSCYLILFAFIQSSAQEFHSAQNSYRDHFNNLHPISTGYLSNLNLRPDTKDVKGIVNTQLKTWSSNLEQKHVLELEGNWEPFVLGPDSILLIRSTNGKYPYRISYMLITEELETLLESQFVPDGRYFSSSSYPYPPTVFKYGEKVILGFTHYEKYGDEKRPKKDVWYLLNWENGCENNINFKEITISSSRQIDIHRRIGAGLVKLSTLGLFRPKAKKRYKTYSTEKAVFVSAPTYHLADSLFVVTKGYVVDLNQQGFIKSKALAAVYGKRTYAHERTDSLIKYTYLRKYKNKRWLTQKAYNFNVDTIQRLNETTVPSKALGHLSTIRLNQTHYLHFFQMNSKFKYKDEKTKGILVVRQRMDGQIDQMKAYSKDGYDFKSVASLTKTPEGGAGVQFIQYAFRTITSSQQGSRYGCVIWSFDEKGNLINASSDLIVKTFKVKVR